MQYRTGSMNKIIEINSFRTKLFIGRKKIVHYRPMTVNQLQFSPFGLAKIIKLGEPWFLGDELADNFRERVPGRQIPKWIFSCRAR
jgi:hypothetical protein